MGLAGFFLTDYPPRRLCAFVTDPAVALLAKETALAARFLRVNKRAHQAERVN